MIKLFEDLILSSFSLFCTSSGFFYSFFFMYGQLQGRTATVSTSPQSGMSASCSNSGSICTRTSFHAYVGISELCYSLLGRCISGGEAADVQAGVTGGFFFPD